MNDKKLKIEYVPVDELKPYEGNAKEHPDWQIEQIMLSMKEFGNIDPIGIWRDEIVEGHGRLIAAKELGYEKVPVIRLDQLSDQQRRAYALVHNKLTMNTDFDWSKLEEELKALDSIDMEQFGFDEMQKELEKLDDVIEDDFEPEPPETPKAKIGDIYQLGRHRLMCGDSTDPEAMRNLMGGGTSGHGLHRSSVWRKHRRQKQNVIRARLRRRHRKKHRGRHASTGRALQGAC